MTEQRMADVDHTHPHTDEPFGEPYRNEMGAAAPDEELATADAPEIRTDGGEPSRTDEVGVEPLQDDRTDALDESVDTMADVDHAGSADGVSASFERGTVRDGETE